MCSARVVRWWTSRAAATLAVAVIGWHLVPGEVRRGLPLLVPHPSEQVVTVKSILAAQDRSPGSARTGALTYYITTSERNVLATADRAIVSQMVPGGTYRVRYVGRPGDEALSLESVTRAPK